MSATPLLSAVRDDVRRFTDEQERWDALDRALRRTISRLCIAAGGLSEPLDVQLQRLTTLVRKPVTLAELDGQFESLTRAIAALEDRPGGNALAAALQRLLERLELPDAFRPRIESLRREIPGGEPATVLEQVAELVNEQRRSLDQRRVAAETLLTQVMGRLDEITTHLGQEREEHDRARDNRESLDRGVRDAVGALGEAVAAGNLSALQAQVRQSLSTIDGQLLQFRSREESRVAEQQKRNEALRSRIDELEQQAHELQESVRREQARAHTDALTGVANRAGWQKHIDTLIENWPGPRRPVCVAVWDIDHFKKINDRFGHPTGDKMLQVVARFLSHNLHDRDFVARFGGEEFVTTMDGTDARGALRVLDQLRNQLSQLDLRFRDAQVKVTISCGITELLAGDTADTAVARADAALYQAKENGRNRCIVG
jgi:diguanylate cyclase